MEADKRDIYVFTVKGKENIISYCRQLLRDASQYVMVSMWNEMYELLLPELEECQNRGCKILGVCHNIQNPMDGIEIHHSGKYHDMTEKLHWFIISADGRKLLYGYSAETDRDAFYTEDVSHIYLLEDYIMHDMVINRFISEYKNEEKLSSMMEDILTKMGKSRKVGNCMEHQIEKSNKLSGKMIALMVTTSGIAVANMELQHKWWQELSIGQAEKDGKIPFLIYRKLRRSLKWQKFITKKNAA